MKKIFSILALLGILLSMSYSANAGHNENKRKRCHWYAKKYVAKGHIAVANLNCGVHYSYAKDNGCTWAQINFTRSWCCTSSAEVYSRADGNGLHGFYHSACKMTGAIPSDLMLQMTGGDSVNTSVSSAIDTVNYLPGSQDVSVDPEFHDNDTITISNISIDLSSDINDPNVNTYTLAIWIPQDDTINGIEDTTYTAAKAINASTITLKAGKLTITGSIFSARDFVITQNGDVTHVSYVGGNKSVIIPNNISEDELEISGFGDIDVENAVAMFCKATDANNGIISGDMSFRLYPNPVGNVLNIAFTSEEANEIDLQLFDINGKLIKESPKHSVSKGTNLITLNIGDLPPGQYFMLANGSHTKVVKRFTKK